MKRVRHIFYFLFFLVESICYTQEFTIPKFELLNKEFPITNLVDENGEYHTLFQEKNTTYVFNFWFIGCKPCVAEIPALNKLKKKYSKFKVKFIAITFEDLKNTESFLSNKPFNFEHFHLEGNQIDQSKLCLGYPNTVIVDENKIIRFQKSGGKVDTLGAFEIYDILSNELEKLNPKKNI